MNFDEIKELIKLVSKTGIGKVQVEKEDCKITISGNKTPKEQAIVVQQAQQPAPVAVPPPAVEVPKEEALKKQTQEEAGDDSLVTITSPMIGTFYRSPGPDKEAFVSVGSTFKTGDKLCIIEAMKTFNEIEAEVAGKIVKVLVDDASPVDYEQPLFLVEPA